MDVVVVSSDGSRRPDGALILTVFNALCSNAIESEGLGGRDSAFVIRNVEFRNARTKLAHCFVNNLDVDITLNQLNALASNLLLEEIDRVIGNDHLFKKSVLLIKVLHFHCVLREIFY
jgi:hypothetical protein